MLWRADGGAWGPYDDKGRATYMTCMAGNPYECVCGDCIHRHDDEQPYGCYACSCRSYERKTPDEASATGGANA